LLYHQKKNNPNKIIILIIFVFIASIYYGCGSKDATRHLSAEQEFHLGMKKFYNEDYLEAIDEFRIVSLQFMGSRVADSAQFYMAECRFLREEYILAAFEYDLLLTTMPSSVFVPRARFKRATCYYELSPKSTLDQNYTRKAVDEYQEFLEYHPKDSLAPVAEKRILELNTKLAKKDYENGITYMHMEYYKAATFYFDQVLEKYHDTKYAEPSLLKKAEALMYRKKFASAKETLERFIEKYPDSALISDAKKMKVDIENKIVDEAAEKQKNENMNKTAKNIPHTGI
jgi:outer membrane protein assembly factor BamD